MTPEGSVLKAVCDLLAAERIPFWRMQTGAMKLDKRFVRFGQRGMADVLAFPLVDWIEYADGTRIYGDKHSHPLWIEVKSSTGRQTREQSDFESYVTDNGMNYLLARDSDTVLQWLKDNGVTR